MYHNIGVIYADPVDTPLLFADPRGTGNAAELEMDTRTDFGFEPKAPFDDIIPIFMQPGDVIVFPPWLTHKVPSQTCL